MMNLLKKKLALSFEDTRPLEVYKAAQIFA